MNTFEYCFKSLFQINSNPIFNSSKTCFTLYLNGLMLHWVYATVPIFDNKKPQDSRVNFRGNFRYIWWVHLEAIIAQIWLNCPDEFASYCVWKPILQSSLSQLRNGASVGRHFETICQGESANSSWTIFGYLKDMFLRTRNSVHSSKDYRIQDYITNWCFI